ncbi:hypothetical protein LDENG_00020720 [Lucifuga dentata]|nr:hypothetical protein LDENG_00020720 [Lucifuga dentata]
MRFHPVCKLLDRISFFNRQRSKTFIKIMAKLHPFKREAKRMRIMTWPEGVTLAKPKSESEMISKCFYIDKFFLKTNYLQLFYVFLSFPVQ